METNECSPSLKKARKEIKVKDEYDFVENYCNMDGPTIFWLPENFDFKKFNDLCLERGFVIMGMTEERMQSAVPIHL